MHSIRSEFPLRNLLGDSHLAGATHTWPGNHKVLSVCADLTTLHISYRGAHTTRGLCVWLPSLA